MRKHRGHTSDTSSTAETIQPCVSLRGITSPGNRSAWILCGLLFLAIAAMVIHGSSRTDTTILWMSSGNWLAGQGLYYDGSGIGGFVYFPQAAILFIPFALLPKIIGQVLWRFVSIGVFAAGLYYFMQLVAGSARKNIFLLATLISIPLAWDCVRNGQSTLIMAGLMLLAVVCASQSRWWPAALLLTLSVAFKPLALVLWLLVLVLYRPMTWRLLLALGAVLLFPFLIQNYAYVMQQYSECIRIMTTAAHVGVVASGWTTPFNTLREFGADVPESVQTAIRFVAAFATLALCYAAVKWNDPKRASIFIYSFAALYLMLFSPRTENNTYVMLGPAIAVFMAEALFVKRRISTGIMLGGIALVIVGHRTVAHLLRPQSNDTWVPPIMAVLFCCYLLASLFSERSRTAAPAES
jgi:alpha-1,2-mannosyltransferase